MQAEACRFRDRRLIEVCRRLRIRQDDFAAPVQRFIDRAGFDGELVEREVVGGEGERLCEFRAPGRERLARPRIDEVEGDARKNAPPDFERGDRLGDRVLAAEPLQVGLMQALDADGNAVHPGGAVAREAPRLDAGGIGFQRDFEIGLGCEESLCPGDERAHRFGLHQAWGAAAEEDGAQGARPEARRLPFQFAQQRGAETRLRHNLADMAVEVAVGTFGQAEGPVDVEGERLRADIGHGPVPRRSIMPKQSP